MPPNGESVAADQSPALVALGSRADIEEFGSNAIGLFALDLHFDIDDIGLVGSNSITDGSGDKKCDLVYIDREAGVAVIAQVYRSSDPSKSAAPANKASDLGTAAGWMLGWEDSDTMNNDLVSARLALRDALSHEEIQIVELWYIHNLPTSKNVAEELNQAASTGQAIADANTLFGDIEVRALEVGIDRIDEWYASTQSPIQVTDEISVDNAGFFEVSSTDWRAVCTTVPALWLRDLHDQHGDRLFSANIRGYMPSRRTTRNINFNIEQTARDDGAHFWAYNNGVTALVHEINIDEDKIVVTGIAVVNGAQTTGAIARVGSELDSDAEVLVRFVECSSDGTIESITRFNNSQNPIKPSDFRSTDRQQVRLRSEFEVIPDVTYLGARRGGPEDRARRPSNLLPSDTAAQALACFHGEPGIAYHQLRSIWERDDIYTKFFNDRITAAHIVFAYALLNALKAKKSELVNFDSELTDNQLGQLELLTQRGSLYLCASAIAGGIETYLSERVTDRFRLSFGSSVSPTDATNLWAPIVDATLSFYVQLSTVIESGNLRSSDALDEALKDFSSMIAATATANASLYSDFAGRVVR